MTTELNKKLERFGRALERIQFIADGDSYSRAQSLKTRVLSLFQDKILFEAGGERPLQVVVAGGTNVGKSTVVNQMFRSELCSVSALARETKSPVICSTDRSIDRLEREGFLADVPLFRADGPSGAGETDSFSAFLAVSNRIPEGMLIIDSPDTDSEHQRNRLWAARLLDVSDVILLVVTPEKYHDEVIVRFIRRAVTLGRTVSAIFNKTEGDIALNDFENTIWNPIAGDRPVFRLPWDQKGAPSGVEAIADSLKLMTERASKIKRASLAESFRVLRRETHDLATLHADEQERLEELRVRCERMLDASITAYREEIAGEKFEELDAVFGRLLKQLRIPILDDFYGGIRAVGRAVYRRLGRLAGIEFGQQHAAQRRRLRERVRVEDAASLLQMRLKQILQDAPLLLRSAAAEWSTAIPPKPSDEAIEDHLTILDDEVETWIRIETEGISATLSGKPGLRNLIVGAKAGLQVGSGILGATLTGGLDPTDLALVPALERLSAFLIERGIGYPYFRRCRSRLMDVRVNVVERFLRLLLLDPLLAVIPEPGTGAIDELRSAVDGLPEAKDILP